MKKILIVEDEENISELYKDKLEDLGYDVDIAGTGLLAIDYIRNGKKLPKNISPVKQARPKIVTDTEFILK